VRIFYKNTIQRSSVQEKGMWMQQPTLKYLPDCSADAAALLTAVCFMVILGLETFGKTDYSIA